MIREPKNIANMNECAFKIGIDGNVEKSIQEILDSKPSGYRSKEETASSVRILFEDINALKAYRSGILLSAEGGDPIGYRTSKYCSRCGFNKSCDTLNNLLKKSDSILRAYPIRRGTNLLQPKTAL